MNEKTKKQGDYVAHGSPEHAALLGLKKAEKEDVYQYKGWTLVDLTMFGPQATEAYLQEVIRQKVSELEHGKPEVPAFAPPMWEPKTTSP